MFMRTRAVVLVVLAVLCLPLAVRSATAAGLIRDAEIETTIRAYATPLFQAANLNPNDVRIYIIGDDQINAFVAGGMNLFVNTGLLLRAPGPNAIIGVIAHETGHIEGGHLARLSNRIESGSAAATVATILGILTAVATGSGEAGAAVIQGGQGIAVGSILSFNRAQESSADQAALELLDQTGQSAKGLEEFLSIIESQELLSASRQDPYVRTHPITRDRIQHVRNHVANSEYKDARVNPEFQKMYRRMVAKLHGFLDPPGRTLNTYKAEDDAITARYARAIAYYRLSDLKNALPIVDGLIAEEPENPYFLELKGQMLFENGRIAESLPPYEKAVELEPNSALLRVGLAHSQLESHKEGLLEEARTNLLKAVQKERDNAFAWDQLAIAYGRGGQYGESALASAEAAMARGNAQEALAQANRAEQRLDKGSAAWLRMQDIKQSAKDYIERRN